ncbi:tRNA-splicing endonuclease subunit Sen34 isoform X2 [Myripristis murdjan]|uniref:tRNA-splicing endonuclease subunit Sen34 isoform X2 n=1 Tax=Myripristis murdjan TaxID=586833 RepID=UPI001175DA61|nr:tRNA-splicing endonuclease subunit Sen34 isoform X2 [Myripristis murdjan]
MAEAPPCKERPCRDEEEEEEEEEPASPAVGLSLCGSAPLVWHAADVRAVRALGLVGALVGSLPRQPRQNGRLGRPLLLGREEERLLAESHQAAHLTPAQGGGEEAHRQQVEQYEEAQRRSYEEQSVLALQDRKGALLRAMSGQDRGEAPPDGTSDEALSGRLRALDQSFSFPRSALAVQLSTARAGLACCPETRRFLRASRPIRSQDDGPRAEARYRVFRDLRGRGFYLTSAGKFGGDFLVYPGDPLRFHAHFIAVCVSLDEAVSLLDVLAVARLGSNVKKTVLLCSPAAGASDDQPDVVYTSLQWSGMV